MKSSRGTARRRLLAFGLCFPLAFAMIYTVPALAMSARDFNVTSSALTAFRVAGMISIGLAINLLRYSRRPRTADVVQEMTMNWLASATLFAGGGLLTGVMPLEVAVCFFMASITPFFRLDVDEPMKVEG